MVPVDGADVALAVPAAATTVIPAATVRAAATAASLRMTVGFLSRVRTGVSGPDAVCFGVLPACWKVHAWPVRREDDSGGDVGPPHRWTAVWGQPHVRPWSSGQGVEDLVGSGVRVRPSVDDVGRQSVDTVVVAQVAHPSPESGEDDRLDLVARPGLAALAEVTGARQPVGVLVDRLDHLLDALVPGGDGLDDGWPPEARLRPVAEGYHVSQVAHRRVGAFAVGLVDDEHVADLEDPGLRRLDPVAHTRGQQDNGGVGEAGHLDLGLADADRLDEHDV